MSGSFNTVHEKNVAPSAHSVNYALVHSCLSDPPLPALIAETLDFCRIVL